MRKYVIEKLDSNNNVVMSSYSDINSKTVLPKNDINDDIFSKIQLEKYKIDYVKPGSELLIEFSNIEQGKEYDKFIVIFDVKLLENKYLYPFVPLIREYINKQNKEELRNRKVKRENRYKGAVVIAAPLLVSLLVTLFLSSKKKNKKSDDLIMFEPVITSSDFSSSNTYSVPEATTSNEDNSKTVYIDCTDFEADLEKSINVDLNYADTIKKYAEMYNVNPDVMIAIAKQERGFHSETMDADGATGLMQIQNSAWVGQELTAKNYKTGEYDTFIVTVEDLGDVEKNIRFACMIMQNVEDYMDQNELLSIQCYNMGVGNMEDIFNACEANTGISKEEVKNNPTNKDWLYYRNVVDAGDMYYLERILTYIMDRNNSTTVELKSKGEKITVDCSKEKVR